MKYQVLGHRRRLQKGDIPYELICEFENPVEIYYMMDKADRRKYDEVIVIDTYTNELVASKDLSQPLTKKKRRDK